MNSLRDRWLTLRSDQSGLTLVELLIAMLLFSILSGVLLSSLIATRNSTQATQQQHDINQEARQGKTETVHIFKPLFMAS